MTCLHLSHSADASDGGIAISVAELLAAQQAAGLDARWLTADRFAPLHRDRLLSRAVGDANPSLLHLHGLWRSPTRIAPHLAACGQPLLIATHGMLDPGAMRISHRKKRLVWHLWERRALTAAHALHALCPEEAAAIRSLLPDAPIAVIPNGVALPPTGSRAEPLPPPPWIDQVSNDEQVLLFLGRFHSKKGLDPLLSAWQTVAADAARQGWWLALVGYGDGGALQRRLEAAPMSRVLTCGPVFGAEKQAAFAAASGFVLPSFSEGLPMAALEAMAHRLPCLLSSFCNLPEAYSSGAALPAQPEPAALAASLQHLFALSRAERAEMGRSGRSLVAATYSWPQVAEQTRILYRWILGGGERPYFVR